MATDSYILRITGKAELPRPIEVGHNYHVSLEGSVVEESKADNQDGSLTYAWKFKPVKIELLEPKGETLKLKDPRSKSALFRSIVWKRWKDNLVDRPFDEYYDLLMNNLIIKVDDIVEKYGDN